MVRADSVAEPLGQLLEKRIAGGVAEHIVHLLEAIKIKAMDGKAVAATGARQDFAQPFIEEDAVWQVGQQIMVGYMSKLFREDCALSQNDGDR